MPILLHPALSSYASALSHFATLYCIRVSFLSLTDSFSILQPQPSWPIRYRLSDPGASAISPVHYILPSVFGSGGAIDSSRLVLTLSWYLKAWSTLEVFVATVKPHHHDFASRALFDVYGSQLLDSTAHYSKVLIRLEKHRSSFWITWSYKYSRFLWTSISCCKAACLSCISTWCFITAPHSSIWPKIIFTVKMIELISVRELNLMKLLPFLS